LLFAADAAYRDSNNGVGIGYMLAATCKEPHYVTRYLATGCFPQRPRVCLHVRPRVLVGIPTTVAWLHAGPTGKEPQHLTSPPDASHSVRVCVCVCVHVRVRVCVAWAECQRAKA